MNLPKNHKKAKSKLIKKLKGNNIFLMTLQNFHKLRYKKVKKKLKKNQIYRFIFFNILNTLGSYIVYCLFLIFLNYLISYFLSLSIFLCISSYLNEIFVFNVKPNFFSILLFGSSSLMQIVLGGILINFSVQKLLVPELFAPLINILFITPLIYLLNIFLSSFLRANKYNQ